MSSEGLNHFIVCGSTIRFYIQHCWLFGRQYFFDLAFVWVCWCGIIYFPLIYCDRFCCCFLCAHVALLLYRCFKKCFRLCSIRSWRTRANDVAIWPFSRMNSFGYPFSARHWALDVEIGGSLWTRNLLVGNRPEAYVLVRIRFIASLHSTKILNRQVF